MGCSSHPLGSGRGREWAMRLTTTSSYMLHDVPVPDSTDAPDVTTLIVAGRDREAARRGAGRPNRGTMDPLTQLAQLSTPLGEVLAGLTAEDLDRPTPCADFTVRGVLEHMIGGATAFAAEYRGTTPAEPDFTNPVAGLGAALGDLVAAVNEPGALDATVAAPFGDVPGDVFARFIVLDGLVHGWDMATASGQTYQPPDELVAAVADFARGALDPLRDGQTFAAAVDPGPDATPIEQLAAYTGRSRP